MIAIMSTVLCSERKKGLKKDLNAVQKPPVVDRKKDEIKKDVTKTEFIKGQNLVASNHPAKEVKNGKDGKEKEKNNNENVLPNQLCDVESTAELADPNDKEAFYPPVPEPTPSAKRKREEALENDKKQKIKEGFYQSRSDEDDTLEAIKSLKDEETDPADKSNASKRIKRIKSASHRAKQTKK